MPRRLLILLVVLLAAVGCSKQEPEVAFEEQIPAALREQAAAEEAPEGGEEGESAEIALEFVAVDIDFSQAPDEAPAGPATVAIVNEGNIIHNVAFDELGGEPVVEAEGGETATGTVNLEPGTYTYFCSIPGHRAAGMEGELTVS